MIQPTTAFGGQGPVDGKPKYVPGQLVRHRVYQYRGVVVSYDLQCMASDEWYQSNQTQPNRQQPWYHVLVDGSNSVTYAAQENLQANTSKAPVHHPLLETFFSAFKDDHYVRNDEPWPS